MNYRQKFELLCMLLVVGVVILRTMQVNRHRRINQERLQRVRENIKSANQWNKVS